MILPAYQDHPRLRGNDADFADLKDKNPGSPPLARERRKARYISTSFTRITPACAGTTGLSSPCVHQHGDHPRLRGNDWPATFFQPYSGGSPPLARERRHTEFVPNEYTGITPACAGTTFPMNKTFKTSRDHPRLRGNDTSPHLKSACPNGSPPLARERQ